MAVRVKQMEWDCISDHGSPPVYRAATLLGEYVATSEYWYFSGQMGLRRDTDTLSGNQIAAQADYEARILSAIELEE